VADTSELGLAFDAAVAQISKCMRAGMEAVGGESAKPYLEKLQRDLAAERERAVQRGSVDKAWFQTTVRWLVEWVPESEPTLIAAMGRIARVRPPSAETL
jgi:hypothetical protein